MSLGSLRYLLVAGIAFAVAGWGAALLWRTPAHPRRTRTRRRTETVAGWGLLAGVIGGVGVTGEVDELSLRLLVLGVALGAAGILGDRRRLPDWGRVAAEVVAAVAAVALGVETELTAVSATNAVAVVGFVVVTVEALRALEAGPAAAAAVGAPALASLGAVAAHAGQPELAVLAVATAGGLAGTLAARARRRLWLGDSGCLLAGFLLAALVVTIAASDDAPTNAVVIVPLVALPMLNAALVAVDRLRRRRPFGQARQDGLAHRLRARPLRWGAVLGVLLGAQALIGVAVVLAARGTLPAVAPPATAAVTGLAVVALASGKVHSRRAPGLSVPARIAVLATLAGATALVVPGVLALAGARQDLEGAAVAAESGLALARLGDFDAAQAAFERAGSAFAAADESLQVPLASLGLGVPVLGPNLAAAQSLTDAGAELAAVGVEAATQVDGVRLRNAAIDLTALDGLRGPLQRGRDALRRAAQLIDDARSPWLARTAGEKLDLLGERVDQALPEADSAVAVAEIASPLLGGNGPRRYFIVLQTPAELRGSGGILGNFGEMTAVGGRLDLVRTGRAADLNGGGTPQSRQVGSLPPYLARFDTARGLLWQDLTLSPDFPTVASTIEQYYPGYGGQPVDGVISLDPVAIGAFLALTGPVSVPEWPVPIGPDNAVEVLVREQYLRLGQPGFTNLQRVDFLDSLLDAVFDRLESGELPGPGQVAQVLAPMVPQGRLKLHSTRPREQAVLDQVGADGALAPFDGDYAALVTQNGGGNKIDIFLERALDYEARHDPVSGQVDATARITLTNGAPAGGLPDYVIGSGGPVRSPPGTNRLFLWFYSALGLDGATLDGRPLLIEPQRDHGRNVYRGYVSIPPGATAVVELRLSGLIGARPAYRLQLGHQPTIDPDQVSVRVATADPSPVVVGADTVTLEEDGVTASLSLLADRLVEVGGTGADVAERR